jgi:hypothetical protein
MTRAMELPIREVMLSIATVLMPDPRHILVEEVLDPLDRPVVGRLLAQFIELAALEFVAAPVGIDDECRLAQGQDERRFAVAVAALQGPAPRRKRIFVNSLESHGKVSVIELLKPCPRVEQLRNVGLWKATIAHRSLFVHH